MVRVLTEVNVWADENNLNFQFNDGDSFSQIMFKCHVFRNHALNLDKRNFPKAVFLFRWGQVSCCLVGNPRDEQGTERLKFHSYSATTNSWILRFEVYVNSERLFTQKNPRTPPNKFQGFF